MSITKRIIIVLVCLTVVIIRAIFPELNFDWISLVLIIFSGVLIFVTDLKPFSDRITKVKFGEVELELAEQLKSLSEKTEEKIEETTESAKNSSISGLPLQEESKLLSEKLNSPDAILLMTAIEIEKLIRTIYQASSLKDERIPISVPKLALLLENNKILDTGIADIIKNFWEIRNKIAHGFPSELRDTQMYELIGTGYKIIKLLEAKVFVQESKNGTQVSLEG